MINVYLIIEERHKFISTLPLPRRIHPTNPRRQARTHAQFRQENRSGNSGEAGAEVCAGERKKTREGTFAPIDLLDYIYAVLHSPSYREKYKEFLKIDFPRVPYPEDPEQFWQLVELGGELRQIHLLEHPVVEDFITTYPESGDNVISNRLTKNDPGFVVDEVTRSLKRERKGDLRTVSSDDGQLGKVWINEKQYFGNVPKKAWEFYIGGYQPAEKWLKDRRDRELSIDEIRHYQKIIVALMETDRIMGEIDGVWDL
ncbi:MAG: type ISP restriction/modification enzyme [Gracilimonas sp.]|nr:type ISP restriction/modification enzyme [Gracilimonas sp.]